MGYRVSELVPGRQSHCVQRKIGDLGLAPLCGSSQWRPCTDDSRHYRGVRSNVVTRRNYSGIPDGICIGKSKQAANHPLG